MGLDVQHATMYLQYIDSEAIGISGGHGGRTTLASFGKTLKAKRMGSCSVGRERGLFHQINN